MNAAGGKAPGAQPIQEYSIRVPKTSKKKHNVMRFNGNLRVNFSEWAQVKMERENNMKEFKGIDEDMPKFGAGSEFGRDAREEARRKKFGITSKKYKPENQPWILKVGGRTGKKFKGIREGGVSANAAYYVFTHASDGAIEAFPLQEWYNFQPIQRYKALSAEEAEAEFSRRNKTMNYHAIMVRKRLRNDEDGNEDDAELAEGGKKARGSKKEKELKISEMDEWMDSDDEDSDSDEEKEKKASDDEADGGKKKKKKGKVVPKKKKKNASDDEAIEESDDGDEEGRECDYISDSTDSEAEAESNKIKSVAEEDALRKLLASDDEDEEEQKDKTEKEDESDNDENKDKDDKEKTKDGEKRKDKDKKKKKKQSASKKKDSAKKNGKESSSDFSSDSDTDSDAAKDKDKKDNKVHSAQSSRSATPVPGPSSADSLKRKMTSSPDISQSKKFKLDNFNSAPSSSYIPGLSESGITEDAVRRYLTRKPMTTTELLQKFKSKKTGLKSDDLVNVMTLILKKIKPTQQIVKNKMYLSIKPQPH
ncbi:general transcription factor IIF subunit 1 [Diachasma alloeum]|uniref:general transcription factor IIF subunit 1 n=1 Tax=Diachasma alloeum TaxID=454923 RepID=UPI0007383D33|nr:general transcription factor IIF subunit 1 [Diachasma alloeum]